MEGLKKFSKVSLVVSLLISAFLIYLIKDIRFDYDFEAFFPEEDPETVFFKEHRARFESDNDFIFVALTNHDGVFEKDFLQKVQAFTDSLKKDTLVREVQSLTSMSEYVKTPFSPMVFENPYLHIGDESMYEKDSARIFKHPELVGFFINQKADALMVYIKHQQYMSKKKCDLLKEHIDAHIASLEFDETKYAGRAIGMSYYINKMQYETVFFIGLSFILVIIFLAFTFKSIWGIWVPLVIVGLSMGWIVGFMVLVNQPINLILTVLPSIIFVVAMSDVIHLVSKYLDELRTGKTKLQAIYTAYKEVGIATLMTSLTTAIGFITLLTVNMEPVQDFGVFTAIGVMLAFLLAYITLPGLLFITKPPRRIVDKELTDSVWYGILHKTFSWLIRKRKLVLTISVIVAVISTIGTFMIKANYYLLEDISKSSKIRQDYEYFDKEFMGLRPFEMAVVVKDQSKTIYDYDVLKEINKVENYLERDYGLKHCFSIVSVLEIANRTQHGGQLSYARLPEETEANDMIEQIKEYDKKGLLTIYVDSTEQYGRISSTIGDIGLIEINKKNTALNQFISDSTNTNLVEFKMTGTGHLLDLNMSYLSKNLLYGLLISIGLIGIIMGLLYRSLKMVLIALVVNIMPLIMIAAVLGFSGVDLKVSTAIIFTISFGIAVDDTLHFMSRFRLELSKGRSYLYAMKRTFLSTGKAMVLTSVILCAGFLLLMLSDFLGTFYVGLLISLTLFFALINDLFLLPVLLMIFYKGDKK